MFQELLLPIGVLAAIASMLIPLPTELLDCLLVGNLVLGVVLLINTLFLTDPLKLSSLPTMLLLATLFRLTLNVSTTRLILSRGEAGQAVEAFGAVVMQGSVLVGVVVFLVITMVQFIVIAKGSERVAEVAARFTLDALPGKQMSIDADVRSGILNFESAREKRQDLQTESRFYGALDGAMKFIKGDAIAGLVIIAINIVGGLIVGVLVHGLELSVALHKFTLLTVGDGLLSQLPALLNSLAAGMVVTRVVRVEGQSLAQDIFSQLGQMRKVKFLMAVVSATFVLVPGMPTVPFGLLAVLFAVSGLRADRDTKSSATRTSLARFEPRLPPAVSITIPRRYFVGLAAEKIQSLLDGFRQELFEQTGLLHQEPKLTVSEEEGAEFSVFIRGVRVRALPAAQGEVSLSTIFQQVGKLCVSRSVELIDDAMSRRVLDHVERECPELVSSLVPGIISVTQLTELFRALVAEGLSIRSADLILQSVAEAVPKLTNDRSLLEEVRVALKRVISATVSDRLGVVRGYTLTPAEDLLLTNLALSDTRQLMEVQDALAARLSHVSDKRQVLVVGKRARKVVRDGLIARGVEIPVLCFEELSEDVSFDAIETIELTSAPRRSELVAALAA